MVFQSEYGDEFVRWWETTQTGYDVTILKKGTNPNWLGKDRRSDIWTRVEAVANIRTGEAKVFCKSCRTLLNHPNWPTSHGNSAIHRHLSRDKCRTDNGNGNQQQHIKSLFAVYIHIIACYSTDKEIY